jgi:hypothetical protein
VIDAYIVRDPQGRVIGISVVTFSRAVSDARANLGYVDWAPFEQLTRVFLETGSATISGYTLKREQVDL